MSVISEMIDDVFAETDIALSGVYREQDVGAGTPVAVVRSEPDAEMRLGSGRIVVGTHLLDMRTVEVAKPSEGDTVQIGIDRYRIVGTPKLDEKNLIWSCQANILPK